MPLTASTGSADALASGRLENNANNSSTRPLGAPGRRRRARADRYRRRSVLWELSGLARVRRCGRVRVGGGHVGVRCEGDVSGLSGLETCGSVWSCPVCAAKVAARRSEEIREAVEAWEGQGGQAALLTLTMRHHRGHGLVGLWDALAYAWGAVTSGRAWVDWRERAGIVGWVRVVEVTYGRNGWHVHVHALLLLGGGVDAGTVAALRASLVERWARALARRGHEAWDVGQDLRLVDGPTASRDLSRYVTKGDVGLELVGAQTKDAGETAPVWELLARVADDGDADALDLWHEWEAASRGRRQIAWSVGLRDRLGLGDESSDEDIAAEDIGHADLVLIDGPAWDQRVVPRPWLIPAILEAAERGPRAVVALLERERVAYSLPDAGGGGPSLVPYAGSVFQDHGPGAA